MPKEDLAIAKQELSVKELKVVQPSAISSVWFLYRGVLVQTTRWQAMEVQTRLSQRTNSVLKKCVGLEERHFSWFEISVGKFGHKASHD